MCCVDAELFEAARAEGSLTPRSAVQQIEHWARMVAALESCGLTMGQVASLLEAQTGEADQGDAELWKFKRGRQRNDIASGQSQDQLSRFSGGKTRKLKIHGSPY